MTVSESKMMPIVLHSLALIVVALILAHGLSQIMPKNRTVSVRGLSERDVDADSAVWSLGFSIGNNNLPELQRQIVSQTKIILDFLKSHGLEDEDFSILSPQITDTTVNIYMNQEGKRFNYVAKQNILVRSSKVQAVKNANSATLELLGKGISVNSDYENRVQYFFNGLNEIKPEMIAEATESARLAAQKFAEDSKSKVGKIYSATQGLFSIEDAAPGLEEKKHIRVVTTVVYSLAD